MGSDRRSRRGFSLVELLVVLGVLALLLAILLPVVVRARRAGRATVCLANLRGWSRAFEAYLGDNRGRPIPAYTTPDRATLFWWEQLSGVAGVDVRGLLICPDAATPGDSSADPGDGVKRKYQPGSAQLAWRVATYDVADPQWVLRGDWTGSYGLNTWVFGRASEGPDGIRQPAKNASEVPLIGDGCDPLIAAQTYNLAPRDVRRPELEAGMSRFCIDRHGMAINVAFLDGHAGPVALADLWGLRWTARSTPRVVTVPRP